MHFWIDKRSQACGFGRARVAASLSGNGLGFAPHHPRRIRGKSMVTPLHRFQPIPHNNRPPTSSQPSSNHHHNQQSHHSQTHHLPSQQGNNSHHHHHNNHSAQHHQTQQHNSNYQNHHQYNNHQHHPHIPQQQSHHHPPQLYQQQPCVVPVPITQIYGGPSHSPELEHGPLGIGTVATRPHCIANPQQSPDAQLLPVHLKCGVWASLALATVFVAGAKFYFDHQGTGLEVLIFCAFSAAFFLAACTVSLCRRQKQLQLTPTVTAEQIQTIERQASTQLTPNPSDIITATTPTTTVLTRTAAPPPPYHIAILLPESSIKESEVETPPPSYDKLLI